MDWRSAAVDVGREHSAGPPGDHPGIETSVVAFATDIPALTAWGTPYLFGPGSIHVAHSDHEFIDIAELHDAVTTYERIAETDRRELAQPSADGWRAEPATPLLSAAIG